LFSVARYEQVIDAYMSGLERRLAAGQPIDAIASVASFFVSRVDAKVDPLLPADSHLRGNVAIANARLAYARYLDRFSEDPCLANERWLALRDAGARAQRPLWASTGTKDPAYSDVLYVDKLITRDAINTMPEATLRAFADHGDLHHPLGIAGAANATLRRARQAGIELDVITHELEREGVSSFCDSYHQLLDTLEAKLRAAPPLVDRAPAEEVRS
jgi:transaldolase